MHLGSLLGEQWLAARVAQANAQRPDRVVLLGDIFEGHDPSRRELISTSGRLSAPLGVWAVPGNHEFYGGHRTRMRPIEDAGFQILRNRWAEVRPGLVLAGVEDFTALRRSGRGGDIVSRTLAARCDRAVFSHALAGRKSRASRMLSGQTHGGQLWPFGSLVRRVYPIYSFP